MAPELTFNELKAQLDNKIHHHNKTPVADFCGLSPEQLANWLYAPFHELQSVTVDTPQELSTSPVMRYLALILDEAMSNGGSFKATSKGNLPAKLVKQACDLLPEFAVAELHIPPSINEYMGSNEDKFNALHYARVLAELAGVIYRRAGRFHVKKQVQKQYQAHGVQAFFKPMLEAAISKYNWGYFDLFEYDIDLSPLWLLMLWRLQHHASVTRLVEELISAFPELLCAQPTEDYFSPKKKLSLLIETRFIERCLQFWGFVILDPRGRFDEQAAPRGVQVQQLFTDAFRFTNFLV
ncbi:hypothetical protein [Shewanella mangrovi]|uniref:hypothetical protein n=1 Tax=Shewanella mangrovi TaxID=1515746 RepID=UPI0005613342|nr:hypothetical protein [Shewanella mangrovi]